MKKGKGTTNAVKIVYDRYIGYDKKKKEYLEIVRLNAEIAQMIYDLRKESGLTQKELAQRVGTTQSVISRLEDADYESHSLQMLCRIIYALDKNLSISITDKGKKGRVVQSVLI